MHDPFWSHGGRELVGGAVLTMGVTLAVVLVGDGNVFLLPPLAVVAMPFFARPKDRERVLAYAAIAMLLLAVIGSASVGVFYYPSVVALAMAAARAHKATA